MIEKIKYILDSNKFNLNKIFALLSEHGITFTQTIQKFKDIFSYNTTTEDIILIVSTNYIHKHEANNPDNPTPGSYIMCSILIPRPPYLLLTFSSTNQNCWLGTQCNKHDWGVNKKTKHHKTLLVYMKDNMYQKIDPIKNGMTIQLAQASNIKLT